MHVGMQRFLAINPLRSNSRYRETGVVGVVCRHEYPLNLSLQHGER